MELTKELKEDISELMKLYPDKTAALIPALHLVRDKFNILTPELEEQVAGLFNLEPIRVHSVASFYSMLNQQPVGKYDIKFCATLGCGITGGESLMDYACEVLNVKLGEVTADGKFSVNLVECLGSCGTGPAMQINREPYIENLTREKLKKIIEELKSKV
ncbi:MAG: NAD(P)H-dependent oxidoreductase subunit E [Myxococcota bacterium]